jgi:hypothetical protein
MQSMVSAVRRNGRALFFASPAGDPDYNLASDSREVMRPAIVFELSSGPLVSVTISAIIGI